MKKTSTHVSAVLSLGLVLWQPLPAAPRAEDSIQLLRLPDGGLQPQAAVDQQGVLHLVYFKGEPRGGDIFYVRSENSGQSFSTPLRINSQPGSAVAAGTIRGAQLALGREGRVHVAWNGSASAKPKGPRNPEMPEDNPHNGLPMLYSRLNKAGEGFELQRSPMRHTFGLDGGGSIAADPQGNVYVAWHGKARGAPEGEAGRQVFITSSTDDGKTFSREKVAFQERTGACGCCGMRLFVDRKANLYGLYRSATKIVHRDIYLLISRDQGESFQGARLHEWEIGACPMSSMSFAEGPQGVIAAWETQGQVYWATVDPETAAISQPVAPPGDGDHRKHPVVVTNDRGQTLLVWVNSMGWNKPGDLHWQLFDAAGKAVGQTGLANDLPVWSFGMGLALPGGSFAILY